MNAVGKAGGFRWIGFFAALVVLLWGAVGLRAQDTTNVLATNFLEFSATAYVVNESTPGYAVVIVKRTGDLSGTATVDYSTTDGTAVAGIDYMGVKGTFDFEANVSFYSFFIRIFDNFTQDGNKTINLTLGNVKGDGAFLGTNRVATLTIVDDESEMAYEAAGEVEVAPGNAVIGTEGDYAVTQEEWRQDYSANGYPGAMVTIVRKGGSKGRILVDFTTTTNIIPSYPVYGYIGGFFDFGGGGGLAEPGVDFIATNGTVTLDDFQMSTNVLIKLPNVPTSTYWYGSSEELTNVYELFPRPKSFGFQVSNVRPAPEEDPSLIKPTLGVNSVRNVDIVDNGMGFAFLRLNHRVSEGAGIVNIWVRRSFPFNEGVTVRAWVNDLISGGSEGDHMYNSFSLIPSSDYAAAFADYLPPGSSAWWTALGKPEQSGDCELTWGANEGGLKAIQIPIVQDREVEFDEDMQVQLYQRDGDGGYINPFSETCTVTIEYDDEPAGAADRTFNVQDDPMTNPPYNMIPGANNQVQAVALQPDGKQIIAGDFTAYNTYPRNRITRVLTDGQIDPSFVVGTGADNYIKTVAIQEDGKIIIGGGFTSFNGTLRYSIARLLPSGAVDPSFNPGIGADGPINTAVIQPDGKILIGGEFNYFDGTNRNYIARLNTNGTLDVTFDPGEGPNGPVNSIAMTAGTLDIDRQAAGGQAEDRFTVDTGANQGTVVIRFDFLTIPDTMKVYSGDVLLYDSGLVNGERTVTLNYSNDLSTDITVIVNEGNNSNEGTIWEYGMGIIPIVDTKPVIGGNFTTYDGTNRNYIARLNLDGTLDTTFDPGTGADDVVYAVAKQGNKVVLGGAFTEVDLRKRSGIARLNENGHLDTGFDTGTGTDDTVLSLAVQPDGKTLAGGLFTSFNSTRRVGLLRLNLDGTLDTSFMDTAYNQFAGIPAPLMKLNPLNQENFIQALAAYRQTNASILVITNVTEAGETNYTQVTNYYKTDYVYIGGNFKRVGGGFRRVDTRSRYNFARLVGGATPGPGNIEFKLDNYNIDEDGNKKFITMQRVNGSLAVGRVTVATADAPVGAGVAVAGQDYYATNRVVGWASTYGQNCGDSREVHASRFGPNNQTYTTNRALCDFTMDYEGFPPSSRFSNPDSDDLFITLKDDTDIEGDEVFNLVMSNPVSSLTLGGVPIPVGLALGKVQATMTIVDNDYKPGTLGFSALNYYITENGKKGVVTVTRLDGSSGDLSIDYATSDGTAQARKDYTATKGRLSFATGQTTNYIYIPIIDNTVAELDRTIKITLSNPAGFPADVPVEKRLDPARATATLTIVDDDFAPGRMSFDQPNFNVSVGDGLATVIVRRNGGSLGDLKVSYTTSDGSALAGTHYQAVAGTLQWVDGDITPRTITIPIYNVNEVGTNRIFSLHLTDAYVNNQPNTNALGQAVATVTMLNANSYGVLAFSQSAYNVDEKGAQANITVVRKGGLAGAITVDYSATALNAVEGVNFRAVRGTLSFAAGESAKSFGVPILDDGQLTGDRVITLRLTNAVVTALGTNSPSVLGSISQAALTIIDRELSNIPAGSIDKTFDNAQGTDKFIYAAALQPDGSIVLGGDFSTINQVSRNRLARLTTDGTLDTLFDPAVGPNDSIRAIALQSDSRILIGGLFTTYGNTNRNYIARLSVNGAVDATFNPGAGADNPIYGITLQDDNRILAVGDFATFNGISRRHIVRLNTNGVVDLSFNPGNGANGPIFAVVQQTDGRIVIGGDFTTFDGVDCSRVARLNRNGSLDTSFNSGTGANAAVRALALQPDGQIIIGGLFTNYNGVALNSVARLNQDGSVDSTFKPGVGADNAVYTIALQIDGKIVLGGDFTHFDGINRSRLVRLNSDGTPDPSMNVGSGANGFVSGLLIQPDRKIVLVGGFTEYDGQVKRYLARVHGGAMADSGSLEFAASTYEVSESATNATVVVRRKGGTYGSVSVDYKTIAGGTATSGADYTDVSGTLTFREGETFQSFVVPIVNDTLVENDETAFVVLTNFVGALVGNQPSTTIKIKSDDSVISFSSPVYTVNENAESGTAVITVNRSGALDTKVTVNFQTASGTAVTNVNYLPTEGTITFGQGEFIKTFAVSIINNTLVEGNKTVSLLLSSASEGAILDQATATLNIADDDYAPGILALASANYYVDENGGSLVVTVLRTNGSSGIVLANYATRDGSATVQDYYPTNGLLAFADGETSKSFEIRVKDDLLMEDDETFDVYLYNPTGGATLGSITNAIISIVNNNYIYGNIVLSTNRYVVQESSSNAVVTVLRRNGTAGVVQVDYQTSDGGAVAGVDYTASRGTLTFTNGEASKTFIVPIINDSAVEGSEAINITLTNPKDGATLGRPRNGVILVEDDDLLVNIQTQNAYVKEDEDSVSLTITRTQGGPASMSVDYATVGGTAVEGVNYAGVKAKLTFGPGEYERTVTIPILNNDLIEGNKTILVALSNPSDGAKVGTNGVSTITVLDDDGSLVVAAGSALIAESAEPSNGVIDTNETVTVNFGFRNIGKRDTTNLVVTLLATNGVVKPSKAQTIGVLKAGGSLVATPFEFTAMGTNGGTVTATFDMSDGATPLGKVTFTFILGSSTTTFVNQDSVTILDKSPAATYPSTINVSGMQGRVSRVSVSLIGLAHGYPKDLDILLVSPTGESVLLLSDAGGDSGVTNINLTFNESATNSISETNRLVSGLYIPTNYRLGDTFATPAPQGPYSDTLAAFRGINPNGTWSLFIMDDDLLDSGKLVGGWTLSITTVKDLNTTADLAVGMTALPDSVIAGSNISYTISVTNFGPTTATGVTVTNELPAGFKLVSATVSQGSYTQFNNQVIFNFLLLTNGFGAQADLVVTPAGAGAKQIVSRVGAVQVDLNPSNDSAIGSINVISVEPPKITSVGKDVNGQFQVVLGGYEGQSVVVETSTNLINWTVLSTNSISSGVFIFTDPNTSTTPYKFFRFR